MLDIIERKQQFFIYQGSHNNPRIMTVIQGIPFYESSGKNSHQKETWFPHRGIKEDSGWIMKPKEFSVPEKILNFCAEYHIDDEVTLKRFGNLQTLCISASLNTGFWLTEKGVMFRNFLYEHYYKYFLDKNFVAEFLQAKREHNTETSYPAATINKKLRALNTIIPLNISNSRLPYYDEIEMIPMQMSKNMQTLFEMLLLKHEIITIQTIKTLEILSSRNDLFVYVMQNYMDDPDQLPEINKLIKMRGNKITLEELAAANFLESAGVPKEQYEDLCVDAGTRKNIRQINRVGGMTEAHLHVLRIIKKEETENEDIYDIMTDPAAFELLKRLLDEGKFRTDKIITLVIKLKSYDAIETYQELFEKEQNEAIIFGRFLKYPPLTKGNLKLIAALAEKDLIEYTSILQRNQDSEIVNLIERLLTENKLTAAVLEMLNTLDLDNLLDADLVSLIADDAARNVLLERIELDANIFDSHENAANAITLNIVKAMFEEKVLDRFENLLNENITYKALEKLESRSRITHNNLLLIEYLHKTNSMQKFDDLAEYYFLKKLNKLSPEEAKKDLPTLVQKFYSDQENVASDVESKDENATATENISLTEKDIQKMKYHTARLFQQGYFSEDDEKEEEKKEDLANNNDSKSQEP